MADELAACGTASRRLTRNGPQPGGARLWPAGWELFGSFDEPVASASIAQVHFATLKDGREVAVKVLRPGMLDFIDDDLALMRFVAVWIERLSATAGGSSPRGGGRVRHVPA